MVDCGISSESEIDERFQNYSTIIHFSTTTVAIISSVLYATINSKTQHDIKTVDLLQQCGIWTLTRYGHIVKIVRLTGIFQHLHIRTLHYSSLFVPSASQVDALCFKISCLTFSDKAGRDDEDTLKHWLKNAVDEIFLFNLIKFVRKNHSLVGRRDAAQLQLRLVY